MYCIYCGTNYPEQATFCPKCGKPVHTTSLNEVVSHTPSMVGEAAINGSRSAIWQHNSSTSAKWIRRVGIPLATLAWFGVIAAVFWAVSHVARSLILLIIAAILAYALAPLVNVLHRFMPRLLAILLVYLIAMGAISIVLYFLIRAALTQAEELQKQVNTLLRPGQSSPLISALTSLGIDPTQLQNARQVITSHLGTLANQILPVVRSIFDSMLDVIVVAMLSIYLLLDGSRVFRWLRENMPATMQKRGYFLLDTLETVVGGYIRGQLTLSLLIGVLVGAGMAIFGVPHPVLLGELAFLLAFIPVLGTFISGALCILLSLTASDSWVVALTHQTWLLAIIVLVYFVAMHVIESDIVGPRVVGHAVGLHPVISITALIAGAELFGILGALFVAPAVGVLQAVIVWLWRDWRAMHLDQFPKQKVTVEGQVSEESTQVAIEQQQAT
ncbi:MAG TPA: AI-2E family transporter [Ktedonobacteraceae bacterium]|nr:AI-2E family transporter [Ktedonobacteraceae bacterium]